jgi:hypothetical protein
MANDARWQKVANMLFPLELKFLQHMKIALYTGSHVQRHCAVIECYAGHMCHLRKQKNVAANLNSIYEV